MGRRREGPRVDPATIAGVVAPVGWRRAGSSSPHLRAFAIGLARRPSAQRRVRARFVVEAGISLRKSLWYNDLATPYGLRVSHGVSEGRKSRYPLGLREKHAETERSGGSAASPPRCVAVHWRFWTRHGSSWREPARSCFPIGSASSSRRSNCAGCSGSTGSRPCHTAFAQASGTGRPRRRIIGYRRWSCIVVTVCFIALSRCYRSGTDSLVPYIVPYILSAITREPTVRWRSP